MEEIIRKIFKDGHVDKLENGDLDMSDIAEVDYVAEWLRDKDNLLWELEENILYNLKEYVK